MTSIRKTLLEIQQTQSFEQLAPFTQAAVWKKIHKEERDLLARLLVMQGAQQLAKGHYQVLESFELAAQISANSPHILYEQGQIFASYSDNARCLVLAAHVFAQALKQDPTQASIWYARAQVLTSIGLFESDGEDLQEALDCFKKVEALVTFPCEGIKETEVYWKWGESLATLGQLSGEPFDFFQAIEKYRKAHKLGCEEAPFLNDYGRCLMELAMLLDKPEYQAEALNLFNLSVQKDPNTFEGWFCLACCIQQLAEHPVYEKLLEQAEASFAKAAQFNPDLSLLWLKWGQLESTLGKTRQEPKKIESSLEKFAKAYALEPNDAMILNCWAETELFWGTQEERLDLLQAAHAKILTSLEIQPESSDTWYLYGTCLNELGRYFNEEKFYYQAIEKFQYGVSLAKQDPLLWYGLALAYFALGEMTDEKETFEKAVSCCAHVIECGGGEIAQFWNDWGVALLKLAECTEETQYVEQAIEKFERAFKLPVIDSVLEEADLEWLYNYGCAFDLWGELTEEAPYFEKAVQVLTQVVQVDPTYYQARYNLALALSHLGEATFDIDPYYKSLEHFQWLLEQESEDEIVHMDYGVSLINLALIIYDEHHVEQVQTLYRQAETHLVQSLALGNTQTTYQLAGLYSLTGHYGHAMHYLERTRFLGMLPKIEDLLHDEWLEGVRQTTSFRQFINELPSQHSNDEK